MGWATAIVAAVHVVLLATFVLPSGWDQEAGDRSLFVVPMAPRAEEPVRRRSIAPPGETPEARAEAAAPRRGPLERRPTRRPAVPVVVETPGAPEETTIPSTALDAEIVAPTLPLEAGPDGIRRRAPDPATMALWRADSLADARLADLPGAKKRPPSRPVGLAEGGGVTIAIPWQGFLPEDREDGTWRDERCSGGGDGESDKAGEAEGRASQCS